MGKSQSQSVLIFLLCTSAAITFSIFSAWHLPAIYDYATALANVEDTAQKMSGDKERNHRGVTTTSTARSTAKAGDVFVPGSLGLTRHETYDKCYIDPVRYKEHLATKRPQNYGPAEHGLVLSPIAKSGSSDAREKMERLFGLERYSCWKDVSESAHYFAFVREPSSRFLSSFQETLKRWRMEMDSVNNAPPPCYEELSKNFSHLDLNKDNDGVLGALEFFLTKYEVYRLANVHFALQTTRILRPLCRKVDEIYDLENIDSVFQRFLAERGRNDTVSLGGPTYAKKLRLNYTALSLESKRKICQMSALDYCCLNFQLPPECEGAVSCRWIEKTYEEKLQLSFQDLKKSKDQMFNDTSSSSREDMVLMIEPVSRYPVIPPEN